MNQNIIEDQINIIVNCVSCRIYTFLNDIINNVEIQNSYPLQFFGLLSNEVKYSVLAQQEMISQNNNHNANNDNDIMIPDDPTKNYIGILYDIYYYLLLKKNKGEMKCFTLSDFNYPCSFTIDINDTNYSIKVILVTDNLHNDNLHNDICTSLLYKHITITIPSIGYENQYKKHISYNCIFNELINVKKLIHQNKIKVY